MGKTSNIEWTDATWNPWHGCTKISPGCAHCYMYRDKKRYGQDPTKVVRSKSTFTDPLKWKEPRMIFTCSWSDFFIEEADEWRPEAWNIIQNTPQHTYLILTKRIARLRDDLAGLSKYKASATFSLRIPDNVWLGVSVENSRFLSRIEILRQVPARVRFISFEPLLGSIASRNPFNPEGIHWAIVGGESGGTEARPMNVEWALEIKEKCQQNGIAFFMKQICVNGKPIPYEQFPQELRVRDYPK